MDAPEAQRAGNDDGEFLVLTPPNTSTTEGSKSMSNTPLTIVTILAGLTLADSGAFGGPIDDLQAHLDAFIANNFPGEMSYTAIEVETISERSDLPALGSLIADNFWVINQTATADDDFTATEFVQLSGDGKQTYIDDILLPKMVVGALVAQVEWTWNLQIITTYALVSPGPNEVGDTENIIDGVAGVYTVPVLEPPAPNPFHKPFKNGFGTHVADYDASLDCFDGDTCSGDATCNEARALCSCDKRKNVKCLPNGNCQMDVAFVGYCATPDIKFKAKDFEFVVSGFGWSYYNASITLNKLCDCNPPDQLHAVGPIPNDVLVGNTGAIQASVQADFVGLPDVGVIFTKLAGAFTFTAGDVSPDGTEALVFTDTDGLAGMTFVGDAPGPGLIEVTVPGSELIGFSFFQIVAPLCAADFNDDSFVDAFDLLNLLTAWGPCGSCPQDLNADGTVDASDLLALLANWGPCP